MSVLFCTPAYGGMVVAAYMKSCMRLQKTLLEVGIEHDWVLGWNESLVLRARMEMSAQYLRETDFKYMCWLDADIDFTADDFAKLWNMNVDIAVGCYAMKVPDKQWYAAWVNGRLVTDLNQFDKPIAVDFAGTGFMLIKREVVLKLSAKAPKYEGPNGEVPAIYMCPIHNGGLESEDYHFCRIAREAGFKVMMDPSVRLGHWGLFRYGA